MWDSEPYTIKSNQKVYMQDWLATHLAKHLVDRQLNFLGLPTDFECSDPHDKRFENSRSKLIAKCIIVDDVPTEHTSQIKQEMELLNKADNSGANSNLSPMETKPWCDSCDSKGVRHKKTCVKYVSPMSPQAETLPPIGSSPIV